MFSRIFAAVLKVSTQHFGPAGGIMAMAAIVLTVVLLCTGCYLLMLGSQLGFRA